MKHRFLCHVRIIEDLSVCVYNVNDLLRKHAELRI